MMNNKSMIFLNRYLPTAFICILIYSLSLSSIAKTTNTPSKNACLISAKALKQKNANHAILFIDVRNKSLFNQKHIAGSINIPLDLLNTKAFLKNKSLLLIGNGWNEQALIDECVRLKHNRFNAIHVLKGGIITWFKGQHHFPKRTVISLTSKEFFNNKFEKKFVPFVVSNKTKKHIHTILPHAKRASLSATKKQLLQKLNRLGQGTHPIVIFSDNNAIVDAALNDYLNKPLRQIYYFEGGFAAYEKVVNLNKRTVLGQQRKRFSTKKPVSCAN